ncbi:hypothetical protein EGT74_09795 [Chitinophaga lutea]|uniref:Uncharacterized protein n=1 Tax=Chitinophaga lutea TaxID=2488634 RepID=A0A3N4QQ82_9BACT|nr:hypothetical protein [Chitinophaga lutea]RPE13784.1 hypothetical protein EGT74_09795 [Chitinophaga lutea]
MLHTNASNMHEEQLRAVITGFIHQLHKTGGDAISHVTVTVHGELKHFSPGREINAIPVSRIKGVSHLSYQEMPIDAPLANRVTIIATGNEALTA